MARGLIGTRAAWVACAGCGHPRIRHNDRGTARCHSIDWPTVTAPDGHPITYPQPCECTTFTEETTTS